MSTGIVRMGQPACYQMSTPHLQDQNQSSPREEDRADRAYKGDACLFLCVDLLHASIF